MFNMHPKCSGIYRIRDNIAKLEIVVHLKPLNSLVNLPPLLHSQPGGGDGRATSTSQSFDDLPVQLRLKWQQKVFSPHEAELFKDAGHCVTDTHKEYHKWLRDREEASARGRSKPRQRRRPSKKRLPEGDLSVGRDLFTYTAADEHQPAEEAPPGGGVPPENAYGERQSMYVYAALKPDTLLVSLHWYPDRKLLQIYPDFNDLDDDPYLIEIDTDYRHLYQYSVVNVSSQRRPDDAPQITDYLQLPEMMKPLEFDYDASHRRRKEFDMPPKRKTRVILQLELRTAGGFPLTPTDSLYVRYYVHLPDGVTLEEGLLHSSSHSASPAERHGLIRLGYTWELSLLCEEYFQPAQQVRLFFEVISEDSWSRERLEGYAHYAMFLVKPDSERVRLDCLRPLEGFMDRLRRYFIGGRCHHYFKRFFVADGDILCNWRHEWQSSGQLELQVHRVTQKNCELWGVAEGATAPECCGMTLDDIMKAYNEARRRLEAVIF